jgi:glycine dehydrogenase
MASMYAVYHGQKGIKAIATGVHNATNLLDTELKKAGVNVQTKLFFDTIVV